MADTVDPGRPRHLSLQEVIDVLDQLTERLISDGVEPERVADAYKIAAFRAETLPASFLFDKRGTLVWRTLGTVSAKDPELEAAIQRALDAP